MGNNDALTSDDSLDYMVWCHCKSSGYVYAMLDTDTGYIKIGGTSRHPKKRWAEQKSLAPLLAVPVFDWRRYESQAHSFFKNEAIGKEMFSITTNEALSYLVGTIARYNLIDLFLQVDAREGLSF